MFRDISLQNALDMCEWIRFGVAWSIFLGGGLLSFGVFLVWHVLILLSSPQQMDRTHCGGPDCKVNVIEAVRLDSCVYVCALSVRRGEIFSPGSSRDCVYVRVCADTVC